MKDLEIKKDLLKKLKDIEYNYNIEEYYAIILNYCIECDNETQDTYYSDYFNDIIDYEIAETMVKNELENGGLIRLYYFLGDANLNNDIFKIDGYGNLTNCEKSDIDNIKENIIEDLESSLNN